MQHYNLRSAGFFIAGSSLHDLNSVDSRPATSIDAIRDTVDRHADDDSTAAVDCMHQSYRNSLPLNGVGVEEYCSSLENNGSSRGAYGVLAIEDVSPIESARARFLQIIVDYFISDHVFEVADNGPDYAALSGQDKLNKRKSEDVQYEGSYTFKIRELATSLETRTRFPELVIQEEKRVRFVVISGLDIVEKPNNKPIEDAEWFKRLTGRNEVAITSRDYTFYSPRHGYRHIVSIIP